MSNTGKYNQDYFSFASMLDISTLNGQDLKIGPHSVIDGLTGKAKSFFTFRVFGDYGWIRSQQRLHADTFEAVQQSTNGNCYIGSGVDNDVYPNQFNDLQRMFDECGRIQFCAGPDLTKPKTQKLIQFADGYTWSGTPIFGPTNFTLTFYYTKWYVKRNTTLPINSPRYSPYLNFFWLSSWNDATVYTLDEPLRIESPGASIRFLLQSRVLRFKVKTGVFDIRAGANMPNTVNPSAVPQPFGISFEFGYVVVHEFVSTSQDGTLFFLKTESGRFNSPGSWFTLLFTHLHIGATALPPANPGALRIQKSMQLIVPTYDEWRTVSFSFSTFTQYKVQDPSTGSPYYGIMLRVTGVSAVHDITMQYCEFHGTITTVELLCKKTINVQNNYMNNVIASDSPILFVARIEDDPSFSVIAKDNTIIPGIGLSQACYQFDFFIPAANYDDVVNNKCSINTGLYSQPQVQYGILMKMPFNSPSDICTSAAYYGGVGEPGYYELWQQNPLIDASILNTYCFGESQSGVIPYGCGKYCTLRPPPSYCILDMDVSLSDPDYGWMKFNSLYDLPPYCIDIRIQPNTITPVLLSFPWTINRDVVITSNVANVRATIQASHVFRIATGSVTISNVNFQRTNIPTYPPTSTDEISARRTSTLFITDSSSVLNNFQISNCNFTGFDTVFTLAIRSKNPSTGVYTTPRVIINNCGFTNIGYSVLTLSDAGFASPSEYGGDVAVSNCLLDNIWNRFIYAYGYSYRMKIHNNNCGSNCGIYAPVDSYSFVTIVNNPQVTIPSAVPAPCYLEVTNNNWFHGPLVTKAVAGASYSGLYIRSEVASSCDLRVHYNSIVRFPTGIRTALFSDAGLNKNIQSVSNWAILLDDASKYMREWLRLNSGTMATTRDFVRLEPEKDALLVQGSTMCHRLCLSTDQFSGQAFCKVTGVNNMPAEFATIQSAIDNCVNTDTNGFAIIRVVPGVYSEQLHIKTTNVAVSGFVIEPFKEVVIGAHGLPVPPANIDMNQITSCANMPLVFSSSSSISIEEGTVALNLHEICLNYTSGFNMFDNVATTLQDLRLARTWIRGSLGNNQWTRQSMNIWIENSKMTGGFLNINPSVTLNNLVIHDFEMNLLNTEPGFNPTLPLVNNQAQIYYPSLISTGVVVNNFRLSNTRLKGCSGKTHCVKTEAAFAAVKLQSNIISSVISTSVDRVAAGMFIKVLPPQLPNTTKSTQITGNTFSGGNTGLCFSDNAPEGDGAYLILQNIKENNPSITGYYYDLVWLKTDTSTTPPKQLQFKCKGSSCVSNLQIANGTGFVFLLDWRLITMLLIPLVFLYLFIVFCNGLEILTCRSCVNRYYNNMLIINKPSQELVREMNEIPMILNNANTKNKHS